jgi:hypothetical protein
MQYQLGETPPNPPAMWPFVVGLAVVVGGLSFISLRGQHEIHARVERDRAERRRRGEKW